MSGSWIEVFAGLKNPGMRKVLGAILLGQADRLASDRTTTKNLERWEKSGLLSRDGSGWALNEKMLNEVLRSQAKPATDREGVERFFTGLRLDTLPAKPAERFEVLKYIRDAVIQPDDRLTETQLNERLRVIHPDVALVRRYMVDHGLVHRAGDGSVYTRPTR
ncbi:DUF2087 domain-containing protein [Glutamicibacter sp. MNS18]|uniref:DUF2087 domain-containing protein n=1 Tax=Glutamicibacter sp. MNS18 TaxID=2989817 RepID=UPI0022355BB4|nr:DUF2087 domain-containing protein [Glutamicibacter sp. MNS18]MCW4466031.1 DUF2087 domain-containing protein [Glutamicibacter sp. MNS18]